MLEKLQSIAAYRLDPIHGLNLILAVIGVLKEYVLPFDGFDIVPFIHIMITRLLKRLKLKYNNFEEKKKRMFRNPIMDYYFIIAEAMDSQGKIMHITVFYKNPKWHVPDFEKALKEGIKEYSCNIRSVVKV